jgi:hypothetical protein
MAKLEAQVASDTGEVYQLTLHPSALLDSASMGTSLPFRPSRARQPVK